MRHLPPRRGWGGEVLLAIRTRMRVPSRLPQDDPKWGLGPKLGPFGVRPSARTLLRPVASRTRPQFLAPIDRCSLIICSDRRVRASMRFDPRLHSFRFNLFHRGSDRDRVLGRDRSVWRGRRGSVGRNPSSAAVLREPWRIGARPFDEDADDALWSLSCGEKAFRSLKELKHVPVHRE